MVFSREVPEVPQSVHAHEPTHRGCGPNLTQSPALTVTEAVRCHGALLTDTYGVIAVGAQVWARAGKVVPAPQASSKIDNRSLIASHFLGEGPGRPPPVTGS